MEYFTNVLEFFANLGYFGIALGLMVEIIPSELVLGYGGYLISIGRIHFPGALLAGVIGGTMAQLFLYWAGYYGGRPFLRKYGKYIFITERHLDIAEQWFGKYGAGVIFTARFIPVVRHAISIPAGVAKMSAVKFTIYTIAAIVPWTIFFLAIGKLLGENWRDIKSITAPYIIPVVILALSLAIIYYIWRKKQTPPIVTVHKKIKSK
ncbi:DedA family protein [Peribacillus glennii]|uniref:DedA family protein n=1 Tax=Peribacillus glennii TaxID=2303991 RepID=A0A372L962_9BACI|nr:DedA family protein [Peribacillus glennii]RFU62055.1 DedA family protein [Peribacillus glennii]